MNINLKNVSFSFKVNIEFSSINIPNFISTRLKSQNAEGNESYCRIVDTVESVLCLITLPKLPLKLANNNNSC